MGEGRSGYGCIKERSRKTIFPWFDQRRPVPSSRPAIPEPPRAGWSSMAAGHREAARSVLDEPEHGGTIEGVRGAWRNGGVNGCYAHSAPNRFWPLTPLRRHNSRCNQRGPRTGIRNINKNHPDLFKSWHRPIPTNIQRGNKTKKTNPTTNPNDSGGTKYATVKMKIVAGMKNLNM